MFTQSKMYFDERDPNSGHDTDSSGGEDGEDGEDDRDD
jgi:hypothetical protein